MIFIKVCRGLPAFRPLKRWPGRLPFVCGNQLGTIGAAWAATGVGVAFAARETSPLIINEPMWDKAPHDQSGFARGIK